MKATAVAPSNIAFIKYWGKKPGNEEERLPVNGSISMNLSNLTTTTTVEFSQKYDEDWLRIDDKEISGESLSRVIRHLDRIRTLAKITDKARVVSKNNFPQSTGLSSSASGFAALTLATTKAAGLNLTEKELSILARQGSGSACRSIPDGFVEWHDGDSSDQSYAESIFPSNYWDLVDIVVVIGSEKKAVSTSKGMAIANTSPFFDKRLKHIKKKIIDCKKYIETKDFKNFGELIEKETREMHQIAMTSKPPLHYWYQETEAIMKFVQGLRADKIPAYFTINTGHNVHIITLREFKEAVIKRLSGVFEIKRYLVNQPSQGVHLTEAHLF